jgi:hypothetical protein
MAEKLGSRSQLLSAQLASVEARIETGDHVAALMLIRKIEPAVANLPLSNWYCLALSARAEPRNARERATAAKQQLDEIARQWGMPVFQKYVTRPDLHLWVQMVSRLSRTNRP